MAEVGYLITFTKQTSMMGEAIQIQTNLPFGATKEALGDELKKMAGAVDERMRLLNSEVLERTGKNLKEMGIEVPGFNDKD